MSRAIVLGAALLVGCAGPLSSSRPVLLPSGGDELAQAAGVATLAAGAEIIYLGEVHDNRHHHSYQRQTLAALLAGGGRPAVAFEMLPASDQGRVDQALSGRPARDELAQRLDWRVRGWPDFALYWPLFELAQEHGLRVVALDLEPALARRIGREGIRVLGDRAGTLSSLLPPDPAREAALGRSIQKAHCDLLPERSLPFMVQSWHARNVAMARRLAETLRDVPQVVVIIGRGHQEAGGLPDQLAALRPGTRQFVVDMLETTPGESPEETARTGTGDVVWLAPEAKRPDPCEGLRRRFRKHEEMARPSPGPGPAPDPAPAP